MTRAYLIPHRPHQILHTLTVILAILAEIVDEDFVQTAVPVIAHDRVGVRFEGDQVGISGVATHDFEAVRGVLQEVETPACVPEERM